MGSIFLSYKRDDDDNLFNERLIRDVCDWGYTLFRDVNLLPDRIWTAEIDRNIDDAWAMIVIVSEKSSKSVQVTYEWARALAREIPIIGLSRFDSEGDIQKVPEQLRQKTLLKFSGGNTTAYEWDRLKETLEKCQQQYTERRREIEVTTQPQLLSDTLLKITDDLRPYEHTGFSAEALISKLYGEKIIDFSTRIKVSKSINDHVNRYEKAKREKKRNLSW